jgi:hypothetical protein
MDTPKFINEKKAAEIMCLAVQTLRNQRFRGAGPVYYKLNRAVRYRESDIVGFMESKKVTPRNE